MSFCFPKSLKIRKKGDFFRIKKYGTQCVGSFVVFNILNESLQKPRIGITVSKNFGKAHDRNRFKRIVREAFRLSQHSLPPLSIHVSPKKNALKKSMLIPSLKEMMSDFLSIVLC